MSKPNDELVIDVAFGGDPLRGCCRAYYPEQRTLVVEQEDTASVTRTLAVVPVDKATVVSVLAGPKDKAEQLIASLPPDVSIKACLVPEVRDLRRRGSFARRQDSGQSAGGTSNPGSRRRNSRDDSDSRSRSPRKSGQGRSGQRPAAGGQRQPADGKRQEKNNGM